MTLWALKGRSFTASSLHLSETLWQVFRQVTLNAARIQVKKIYKNTKPVGGFNPFEKAVVKLDHFLR